MSCNGSARPCRRTRSPPSIASPSAPATRQVLGPDLPIDVIAIDETNTRVRPRDIVKRIAEQRRPRPGRHSSACNRTNSPARSTSPGRFRAAGVQVMIGGFHVSGCLAMLKETQVDIKVAQELGVSIFAGEAEEGFDEVLQDAAQRRAEAALQPYRRICRASATSPFAALPSRRFRQAHRRQCHELRCRPRLPLPMLVLHHHQRAGAQVALSLAGHRSSRSCA